MYVKAQQIEHCYHDPAEDIFHEYPDEHCDACNIHYLRYRILFGVGCGSVFKALAFNEDALLAVLLEVEGEGIVLVLAPLPELFVVAVVLC